MRSRSDNIHCLSSGACPHDHPAACLVCEETANEDTLLCDDHDFLDDFSRVELLACIGALEGGQVRLRRELWLAQREVSV